MTSRSVHAGFVDLDPSLYRREEDPLCAQRVRDGVLNGLEHAADSMSQVRINWQPVNEDLTVTGDPRRWATGREKTMRYAAAGDWYMLEPNPFGVIDVPRHASGEHYEMRIRTAWGAAAQGFVDPPPSAEVRVRVFLYCDGYDPRDEIDLERDHVWESTFSTTTVGYAGKWIDGATRGPGTYATKLVLTPDVARYWRHQRLALPNSPGDLRSDVASTEVLRARVGVAASVDLDPDSEGPTVIPLMRALHMQGFVGVADG